VAFPEWEGHGALNIIKLAATQMFGLFRPVCPCDPAAKEWLERRLQWLTKQFGLSILLESKVVLPTPEFFPDPYDGSERAVRLMFHRVRGFMGISRNAVEMELFNDTSPNSIYGANGGGFAAGTWQGGAPEPSTANTWGGDTNQWRSGLVRIERSMLDRPADLVGVMAHELAHQRLLGEGRASQHDFDNELLTDLTALYFGFGIFLANNPKKSTGELGYWPETKLRKPEYLSEPMVGYALAHLAWFRDESRPDWARHLRWVPRSVFKQGLQFLEKTADSTFVPIRLR
jgi:hypothetical protein